ncbi:hypothetical protein NC797_17025 [Aquibacillus sp. 3ASR75-11]|uniref:Small, acid-soluble spore protein L n=1 Tax=Terrihalobacillus insolitus TaxID=2950438 RepID=A0A9X4AN71_9BACI|nr:hypothetical protein [Terrihalobacillus insolitus]MDC3415193.1 hypothetical protein [Terrihalobacillus insolitus]MDC3426202.1 hypothetical protein [Terrihalobacillus insolitus]
MTKKNNRDRGRKAPNVNPQGLTEEVANQRPKSELEDNARKSNTKR